MKFEEEDTKNKRFGDIKKLFVPRTDQWITYRNPLERRYLIFISWDLTLVQIELRHAVVGPTPIPSFILHPSYEAVFAEERFLIAFDTDETASHPERIRQREAVQDFCFYDGQNVKFFTEKDLSGQLHENIELLYEHKDVAVSRRLIPALRQLFDEHDEISAGALMRKLNLSREQFYACLFHHLFWADLTNQSVEEDDLKISLGLIFNTQFYQCQKEADDNAIPYGPNRVDTSDYYILIKFEDFEDFDESEEPEESEDDGFFDSESAEYIV